MRILIIEDEQDMVQLIKQRLKQRYIIDAAFNGKTGAHLAQVCDYDLIVLDLLLPDMDGITVCRQIRDDKVKI
jgi:DNA-binding response OmpR family regulator